jgi:hypothetical protein
MRLMAAIVRKTAPIEFHEDLSLAPPTCRDRRVGVTLVSEIADEDDHAEVDGEPVSRLQPLDVGEVSHREARDLGRHGDLGPPNADLVGLTAHWPAS